MKTVDATFENQIVLAEDGDEFIDCCFINSTVDWAEGAKVVMIGCYFKGTLADAAVVLRGRKWGVDDVARL